MKVLFFIVSTLGGENTLVTKVRPRESRVLQEAGVSFVAVPKKKFNFHFFDRKLWPNWSVVVDGVNHRLLTENTTKTKDEDFASSDWFSMEYLSSGFDCN